MQILQLPVVILAGGLATRLRPITEKIPKSLVHVAGRPFAEHQVVSLRDAGVGEIIFCVGYLGEMIESALGDGSRWGLRIRYIYDGPVLLGTGGALRRALPKLGPAFMVMYGDSYLECDFGAVENAFTASGLPGLMTVFRNENRFDRSNVEYREGRILRYDKRARDAAMQHIDYGLGVFQAAALANYPPETRLDLAAIYQDLLAAGKLAAFEVPTRFFEIGSPEGLVETHNHLMRKTAAG
jgi:N-acetyl-alpha-D-muramate 1-phosphate uridylyltransferase